MADIGTAYVRIAPNMTGMQGKIASGMKGAGSKATGQLADELNAGSSPVQGAMSKLGGVAKAGGLAIGAGIAAGALGIAALTKKMALSGAELEQQLGGSEAVFREYAADIQNVALNAYKNMGLSQNEFLAGANKMGSLYQGAGISVKDSMQMSADSIQRATDVASIMGIDTTTALESVTAMAKGNYTMMDNLGVAMNDTALNAYALEKGIGKTTAQMSQAEKVGLATQMFMEKTAQYAGNYAKENETLAGSINTTKKAFEDFMSGGNTIDGFIQSLIGTIQIAVPKILDILPQIADGLGQLITSLGPVIAKVLPKLVPSLVQAALNLMQTLVTLMPTIVQVLVTSLPMFIQGFTQIFLGIVQALPQIVRILTAAIPQIVDAIVGVLTNPETIMALLMGAIQLFLAILQAIPVIITALTEAIPKIINTIVTLLTDPAFILMMIKAGIQILVALIKGIFQNLPALAKMAWEIIKTLAKELNPVNLAKVGVDVVKGLWEGMKSMGGWLKDKIIEFVKDKIPGPVKRALGINSPSKVFMAIGRDIDRGLGVGVLNNAGIVSSAVEKMSAEAIAGMATVDSALSTGLNSSVSMSRQIAVGAFEAVPKVVQNNTFNQVAEQIDVRKMSSDLGYAVAMA